MLRCPGNCAKILYKSALFPYDKSSKFQTHTKEDDMMNQTTEQIYQNIYRASFPKLVTYLRHRYACNGQDAEDIAAQALHILWQKWDTLETHTEAGLLRWLLLCAQNLMRDERKKRKRRPEVVSLEDMADTHHPALPPAPDPWQDKANYDRYVAEIQRRLSEKDAALFHAKIVEHARDEEIAARLGISIGTLRVRWLRVKRRILNMWDELKKEL